MNSNVKKIMVCLIAMIIVIAVATKTLATDNKSVLDEINDLIKNNNSNTEVGGNNIQNIDEIPEANSNTTANNQLNENNQNSNNANKQNTPTTTPYTGAGDYSTIIFIAIFAVSAVYAYKKIKDYNM